MGFLYATLWLFIVPVITVTKHFLHQMAALECNAKKQNAEMPCKIWKVSEETSSSSLDAPSGPELRVTCPPLVQYLWDFVSTHKVLLEYGPNSALFPERDKSTLRMQRKPVLLIICEICCLHIWGYLQP
ncbi:uncharacterized protein LOC110831590 isoform X2 [Zootermopsis nevadensis]|uniref:uncharacterized protein LOC110831590 isoform X2 n=1 Tax=Zootermopsis nevadensis TaxID=136037 RepID=UPI000B8E72CF|nr:uncharacterized protein LOC110831590 isoform X2 [Zootermopsis nevadensis]